MIKTMHSWELNKQFLDDPTNSIVVKPEYMALLEPLYWSLLCQNHASSPTLRDSSAPIADVLTVMQWSS